MNKRFRVLCAVLILSPFAVQAGDPTCYHLAHAYDSCANNSSCSLQTLMAIIEGLYSGGCLPEL